MEQTEQAVLQGEPWAFKHHTAVQVVLRRETSVLLQLLRKTFQAAINASGGIFQTGLSQGMRSLVGAAWDLLGRIIHQTGSKAGSTSVGTQHQPLPQSLILTSMFSSP